MPKHAYTPVGDNADADADISNASHSSVENLEISSAHPKSVWSVILRKDFTVVFISVVSILLGLMIGYAIGEHLATLRLKTSSAPDTISESHLVPSPAYEGISKNVLIESPSHGMKPMYKNLFMGFPTPATDKIWQEFMHGYSLRVPTTAFEALNRTSIPLNDGSGDSWAVLSVSHHLHCLDSIRHQIAQVGCKATSGTKPENYFPPHIDHCIEMIRQRIMCQPDVGLRGLDWNKDQLWASASNDYDRECVDWSQLEEWTEKRMFYAKDELITRPGGDVYPGPYTPIARCEVV